MALTFTAVPDGENVEGKFRTRMFDVALDNSYVAGGYAIVGANVGLRRIGKASVEGIKGTLANSGGVVPSFDLTNGKLMVFYPTGSTLAAPGAIADPILNAGGTAVTASAATGPFAAGRGKEVANATDLSTVTLRMKFVEI
jgi:hypothetical protein